jgi:hypothetical protein
MLTKPLGSGYACLSTKQLNSISHSGLPTATDVVGQSTADAESTPAR